MREKLLRLGMLPSLMATFLFAGSMVISLPTAQAAGAADSYAREITRLINGARAANGKPALAIDVFLASKARDGSIPCPDDPAQTIAGRAKDFATYGQMSHQLRLCQSATYAVSSVNFVNTMQTAWGYGSVGEILLVNGGYGGGQYLYTYKGWSTWSYATTGHGMLGWASSSSHWNIIVGNYDRVGCGAWSPSGSTFYYACLFAAGGPSPSGLVAAPNASPFNDPLPPTPVATPKPAATPVKTPVRTAKPPAPVKPATTPSAGTPATAPAETPAPSPTAGFSIEVIVPPAPAATPSAGPTGLLAAAAATNPSSAPAAPASTSSGGSSSTTENSLVVGGSGLAAWFGLLSLLMVARRRRQHTLPIPN